MSCKISEEFLPEYITIKNEYLKYDMVIENTSF